ncbi:MAG TPA: hypothetical protein PK525_12865, partial [Anaerohalosphaeraceae bacterium]|nr:hypothetical protein [Anaerohalosphaeraceae bacterium]
MPFFGVSLVEVFASPLSVPSAAAEVEPEEGAAEEGEAEPEEGAPEEEESPDKEPPTGEEKDKSDVVPEEP